MSVNNLSPEQLAALTADAEPLIEEFRTLIQKQPPDSTTRDARLIVFALLTFAARLVHVFAGATPPEHRAEVARFFLAVINYFAALSTPALSGDPMLLPSALTVNLALVRSQLRLSPALRATVERHIADLQTELAQAPNVPPRAH